jgi:hypothetical protein
MQDRQERLGLEDDTHSRYRAATLGQFLKIPCGVASGQAEKVVDRLSDQAMCMDLFRTEVLGRKECRRGFSEVPTLRMRPGKVEMEPRLPLG